MIKFKSDYSFYQGGVGAPLCVVLVLLSTIYVQKMASSINEVADKSATRLVAIFGTLTALFILVTFVLDLFSLMSMNDKKVLTIIFGTVWFSTLIMIILPLWIIFRNENLFQFVKSHIYHVSNAVYDISE